VSGECIKTRRNLELKIIELERRLNKLEYRVTIKYTVHIVLKSYAFCNNTYEFIIIKILLCVYVCACVRVRVCTLPLKSLRIIIVFALKLGKVGIVKESSRLTRNYIRY
jgi:hypothetical protein